MFLVTLTISLLLARSVATLEVAPSSSEEAEQDTPPPVFRFNRYNPDFASATAANLCYCTLGKHGCFRDTDACFKEKNAACYHSVRSTYNHERQRMERVHQYGCAPLERGGNGSHLTCNLGRSPLPEPFAISCCYEGNFCNHKLPTPKFNHFEDDVLVASDEIFSRKISLLKHILPFVMFALLCALVAFYIRRFERNKKHAEHEQLRKVPSYTSVCSDSIGGGFDDNRLPYAPINQRTVAQYVKLIKEVARGRYGCVQKAYFRHRIVAVKTFYTCEEDSWQNEKDIYHTQMLNHENILQFIAADICSVDSITQMLLITDYHDRGSLYDYLKKTAIDLDEALQLATTCVSGLEHLHTNIVGTANKVKPEIAHRDLKPKNILVKAPGVCALADFGLAVRLENGVIYPTRVNRQSGTRRYMAPEVLNGTLNIKNFKEFKMADIYSLSLVFWEIFKHSWLGYEKSDGAKSESSSGVPKGKELEYELSYHDVVKADPSVEEMLEVVCQKRERPKFPKSWELNSKLVVIMPLLEDMWAQNASSRHTALKVKLELDKLLPTQGDPAHVQSSPNNSTIESGYAGSVLMD